MLRPNLYAYLQLVEEERQTGWMFIDAICINQDDLDERGSQVVLIPDIYSKAKEVVAWLGSPSAPGTIASNITAQVWARIERLQSTPNADVESALEQDSGYTLDEALGGLQACDDGHRHLFGATQYWRRLWIVQEVLLARVLLIRFGKHSIEWRLLESMLRRRLAMEITLDTTVLATKKTQRIVHNVVMQQLALSEATFAAGGILSDKRKYVDLHRLRLSVTVVVADYAGQDCAVMHDKIFGLLGLTDSKLKPSYHMPLSELFIRVFIECLLEYKASIPAKERKRMIASRHFDFDNNTVDDVPMTHMYGVLASAFSLDIKDPAFQLLTSIALKCCGFRDSVAKDLTFWQWANPQTPDESQWRRIPKSSADADQRLASASGKRDQFGYVGSYLRWRLHWVRTRRKLGAMERRDERLFLSCDGTLHTISEWRALIQDVYGDVVASDKRWRTV
ncbi:Ubiquitin-40S ribosomal protein S27a [Teratosphaeria destructans]|uniref:Ubiquitin-40S ribosomal protein S27a n=1 Tax=Teratosphaeria destructans TaxID=418781 RepID=A0A9W7W6K8_9PEZI|nr:Ubiquitin-40S ribosomal protein S27a [Teratosphaeria destructans]